MTITSWLSKATDALTAANIPSARLDAEVLLAHALNVDRSWLIAHGDDEARDAPGIPATNDLAKADALVQKRIQRVPIAYLLGHKEFYGRDFIVSPDVLIPRPESEMIIDITKEYFSDPTVKTPNAIDIGTGSGCLGITLSLEIPHITMTISDVSAEALMIARQNADTLHANVKIIASDLFDTFRAYPSTIYFDLIVANLPYVDPTWERSPETDHEPAVALFADDAGLDLIKKCIQQSQRWIAKNGLLMLEADPCQHDAIITCAQQYGYRHDNTRDYIVTLCAA